MHQTHIFWYIKAHLTGNLKEHFNTSRIEKCFYQKKIAFTRNSLNASIPNLALTFKDTVGPRKGNIFEDAEGLVLAGGTLHHVDSANAVP